MKTRTTITVQSEVIEQIKAIAAKERREFSAQVSILLEEAIAARKPAAKRKSVDA